MQIILDSDYRVIDMDGSVLVFLDITKAEIMHKEFCSLIHEDVPVEVAKLFCQSVKEGKNHASTIKLNLSGNEVWLGFRSCVWLENGQVSEVTLRLYEVEDEIKYCTQLAYEELLREAV